MVYIGQSKDPERRFRDHIYGKKTESSIIHNAIAKYGVENFKFEIIDGPSSDYNELERYWIAYYKSNDRNYGYNITEGGEDPPIMIGDQSSATKYSDELLRKVRYDLAYSDKSDSRICEEYSISPFYLTLINRGVARKDDGLIYPLRIHGNERKSSELVNDITNDLMYTGLAIETIARKYGIDSNTIYSINSNNHFCCRKDIEYPIRQPYERVSKYLLDLLVRVLSDNKMKFSDIEKKYHLSHCMLSRINQGKLYRIDGVNYPIRSSSARVYKPVETIPG